MSSENQFKCEECGMVFSSQQELQQHANEEHVAARKTGMSFAELHVRAYAGEFPPSRDVDPSVLI
jgi:uncharacterized C2H2 Zn-finger protein